MMLMAQAAKPLPAPPAPLSVQGDCPRRHAVELALADVAPGLLNMLPASGAKISVTMQGPKLAIRMLLKEGEPVERLVEAGTDCEQRAKTAAVIIGVWYARLQKQHLDAPAVGYVVPDAPLPMVSTQPLAPATPDPLPVPNVNVVKSTVALPPPRQVEIALGGLGLLSTDGHDAAMKPGVSLDFAWMPQESRNPGWGLGAFVVLDGSSVNQFDSVAGSARWRRPSLGLGPRQRLYLGRDTWIDFREELDLALVSASGDGFAKSTSSAATVFGLGAGLRLMRTWHSLGLWADVGTQWFVTETRAIVTVEDAPEAALLIPAWSFHFGLGVRIAL